MVFLDEYVRMSGFGLEVDGISGSTNFFFLEMPDGTLLVLFLEILDDDELTELDLLYSSRRLASSTFISR